MKRSLSFLCAVIFTAVLCMSVCSAAAAPVETDTVLAAPSGLLAGENGVLYVADGENNRILALQSGKVTTLAGHTLPADSYGKPQGGYLNGAAATALFSRPTDLVEWMGGIVVSDTGNHCLRLIQDGTVRTLAGTGREGLNNGHAASATFSAPMGLAVGESGDLYVADSGNGLIRKITPQGQVSTYASGFEQPAGIFALGDALYVADAGSHRIFRVTASGKEVIAGAALQEDGEWIGGFADGLALRAAFFQPTDVWATDDALYIADTGNGAVRVLQDGRVSTLLEREGAGQVWPAEPAGLCLVDGALYVADRFAGLLYAIESLDSSRGIYTDVAEDGWQYDYVHVVSRAGLMQGVGDGRFAPDAALTRGMIARILYNHARSMDRDAILTGAGKLTDLPEGGWYTAAADWLTGIGVIKGYPGNRYGGEEELSRQDMVAMIWRYTDYLGMSLAIEEGDGLSAFPDADQVADYAAEAMEWAVKTGLVEGSGGLLAPTRSITRAEVCAILHRWLALIEG